MVKEGIPFLAPPLAAGALLLALHWTLAALPFFVLAAFVAFFFRDPERVIPGDPDGIVSPADGKVLRVSATSEGSVISIFLSIFDVHVNRAPVSGLIVRQEYRPGRFLLAYDERASVENEQMLFTIRGEGELSFALVAGLIARRIVSWKRRGDRVRKGDRIGLIRFGSRVDVFLPPGCEVCVAQGDRVRGGASLIARWKEKEDA